MTPDERWKEISDAFAQYMDKANDERFLPSRIAGSLDIALPQYLALRDDALRSTTFGRLNTMPNTISTKRANTLSMLQ